MSWDLFRESMSRIGGAANGGSAKPQPEREALDRERQGGDLDSPPGAAGQDSAGQRERQGTADDRALDMPKE